MAEPVVEVRIRLDGRDHPPTGWLGVAGSWRGFCGWLELLQIIAGIVDGGALDEGGWELTVDAPRRTVLDGGSLWEDGHRSEGSPT